MSRINPDESREDREKREKGLQSSADFMRDHGWEGDTGKSDSGNSETSGGSGDDPGGPTGASS